MIKQGYAGIIRDSLAGIYGRERTVLLAILINCNHAENPDFFFNNERLPLKRGEWVTSRNSLKKETGLSDKQIRTGIKNLQKMKILAKRQAKQVAKQATILSIEDIDKFLINNTTKAKRQAKQVAIMGPSRGQVGAINNNEEEGRRRKKEDTYSPEFEEFWMAYPKKSSKGHANKTYLAAIKAGVTQRALLDGVARYAGKMVKEKTEPRFIKNPATWLNAECWLDSDHVDPVEERKKTEEAARQKRVAQFARECEAAIHGN